MKTIKEHNDEVLRSYGMPSLSGIECPNCGEELHYINKSIFLLSSPPQTAVKCFNCGLTENVYVYR